jgi:hypothetical protein
MTVVPRIVLEAPSAQRERELLDAVARSLELHGSWAQPPTSGSA